MERLFDCTTEDGSVFEGVVVSPDSKTLTEAQMVYNKAFRKYLDGGAYLWKKYAEILINQGLWTEDKDRRITTLQLLLRKFEMKLKNKEQTVEEATEVAKTIREYRQELKELIVEQNSFSDQTAEGQADLERFNFLCSKCILDKNSRQPFFSSLQDFLDRGNLKVAIEGAKQFSCLLNDVDPDYEQKLPEEIFFKRFPQKDPELNEEDKELQDLLQEILQDDTEDVDMNTIEYSPKKRRRTKKAV